MGFFPFVLPMSLRDRSSGENYEIKISASKRQFTTVNLFTF